MFSYEIDHIICEEGEPVVAYIQIKDEGTGKIIKTVCLNYDKDTFVSDMQGRIDKLKANVESKMSIEAEIRNTLTVSREAITAGKGELI